MSTEAPRSAEPVASERLHDWKQTAGGLLCFYCGMNWWSNTPEPVEPCENRAALASSRPTPAEPAPSEAERQLRAALATPQRAEPTSFEAAPLDPSTAKPYPMDLAEPTTEQAAPDVREQFAALTTRDVQMAPGFFATFVSQHQVLELAERLQVVMDTLAAATHRTSELRELLDAWQRRSPGTGTIETLLTRIAAILDAPESGTGEKS